MTLFIITRSLHSVIVEQVVAYFVVDTLVSEVLAALYSETSTNRLFLISPWRIFTCFHPDQRGGGFSPCLAKFWVADEPLAFKMER